MISSGWAVSPPFPPPCPAHFVRGATSGSCCPVIGTSSNSSPILKSLDNAPLWRRCRPARSGGHRPGTACRSTSCSARNSTTGRAIPMATNRPRLAGQRRRFGRFASAAAELAAGTLDKNWAADLVHANDWQAALAPAYLAWRGSKVPSILTIHNLAYQGLFPRDSLRRIGAPESSFHIDGLEFYDQALVPQGRPRLRLASDHRQRDLCEGDHDARTRLRARRSAAAPLGRRATDRNTERHRRKLGSAAPARNWRRPSAPATGRASRPTPITSASSLAWRCRAVRFSAWSPVWFTRKASTSYCPPPTRSSRQAGRSW